MSPRKPKYTELTAQVAELKRRLGPAPRCDRCLHWDTKPHGYGSTIIPVKSCKKAPQFWDASDWDDDCQRVPKPEFADVKMFVQDASDYAARLLTKADFFCAHFEEKP